MSEKRLSDEEMLAGLTNEMDCCRMNYEKGRLIGCTFSRDACLIQDCIRELRLRIDDANDANVQRMNEDASAERMVPEKVYGE